MRKWILFVAVLTVATACEDSRDATGVGNSNENGTVVGAAYTMNNAASANYVIRFARMSTGALVRVDSIATGGNGTGPDPQFAINPLESQDALILSDDARYLYAISTGSNEITAFRVNGNRSLTRINKVSSFGLFPVSLAQHGDVLYVVNARGGGNIAGFRISSAGVLSALPIVTRPLNGDVAPGPGSIRISPDRRTLVVTMRAANGLLLYPLSSTGIAGSSGVAGIHSLFVVPGKTPFGADFDAAGHYIVAEGNINPGRNAVLDGSTVSSLLLAATVATNTPANVGSVITSVRSNQTGGCCVQITADGKYAYIANTVSGSVTGFSIGADGMLTLLTTTGQTGVTGPNTSPLEMAFAGGFLYVLTPGDGGIHTFTVNPDGSLTALTAAGLAGVFSASVTGLVAL
jgi:6-phosphogluconolactonase (cycloisomerase 2 family)